MTSMNGSRSAAMIGGTTALNTPRTAAATIAPPACSIRTPGTTAAATANAAAATSQAVASLTRPRRGVSGCQLPTLLLWAPGRGLTTRRTRRPPGCAHTPREWWSYRRSLQDATRAAVAEQAVDVIVVGIRMGPDMTDDGIRLAMELRHTHPRTGVVVLTAYCEPSYALALLEGGSDGRAYLLKDRLYDRAQLV